MLLLVREARHIRKNTQKNRPLAKTGYDNRAIIEMNANRRRAKMPTKMPRRVGAHNVMMVLLAAILLIAATNIEATVGLKIDNQLLSAKNGE